jgi:hypothetical protein
LPKNCILRGLSKDIHSVSLCPCQEKFFAFNGETAVSDPLKHTSNGTLELNHDPCLPVNGLTPNRLILTIFNQRSSAAHTAEAPARYLVSNISRYQQVAAIISRVVVPLRTTVFMPDRRIVQIRNKWPTAGRPVSRDSAYKYHCNCRS